MYEQLPEMIRHMLPGAAGSLLAGLAIAVVVFAIFALLLFVAVYIYTSFAWYTIAKKLKYKNAWLAWVPIANFFLFPILAKWHWAYGFLLLIPIANLVFLIIWSWEIYKRRGYNGALSIVKAFYIVPPLIPAVFLADMIILGIIAFEK